MTNQNDADLLSAVAPARNDAGTGRSRPSRLLAVSLAGACLLGAGAGAVGYGMLHRDGPTFDAAMQTTPIAALSDGERTELAGKVVEVFGNKFVLEDGTGRALVETGRAGEGGRLVTANETVTVQGRFEKGFVHASALQRADGRIEELRPLPPAPPHSRP